MGKRADNAKATRAKLLATADCLIGESGYEGVSVDSIVKASGIAKGTSYNYFKVSFLALAINVAVLVMHVYRVRKYRLNPLQDEVYADTKAYKQALKHL